MTFPTFDVAVFANQPEFGFIMRKFGRRLPTGVIMASQAIFSQLPLMLVVVTAQAR